MGAPHLARFSRDVGYPDLNIPRQLGEKRIGTPSEWTGAPRSRLPRTWVEDDGA
jgi:hypothetical protein